MYALLSTLLVAALASGPPTPSAGDMAFAAGDFDSAFLEYNEALTASPDDADANLGLGTIDFYRNDLENAVKYLGRAVQLDPQNARARIRLHAVKTRAANWDGFQIAMKGVGVAIPFVANVSTPILRASANGRPLTFVLDTRADTIEISPDVAGRLKLPAEGGRSVRIDSFATPGLTIRNISGTIAPQQLTAGGRRVDGAIGTSFLYHFLSTIDYAQNRLLLRPRDPSKAFEKSAAKNGGTVVPMWLVADRYIFTRARVNGAPAALFDIDPGDDEGLQVTQSELAAASIAPDASQAFVAQNVALGAFAETNVAGVFLDGNEQYQIFPFAVGGRISRSFFRGMQLTFDFDAMRLIVSR